MIKVHDFWTSLNNAKMPEKKSVRKFGFILLMIFFIWMGLDALSNKAHAQTTSSCHGKFPDPFLDVCWDCIFPVTMGDAEVFGGDLPDTDNPTLPVCMCPEPPIVRVGITVGYWEPMALVDVTRTPFCMVNLDGMQLNDSDYYGRGAVDTQLSSENTDMYHVHWYIFPLMDWLNVLADALCMETGSFDIAYMTELDPTWSDDELAFVLNPEAGLFSNIAAQAVCAEDAVQSEFGLPNDALYWCAGAQGVMYPLTGHVAEHIGGVQASTLLSERMDFKLHREGMIWESLPANDMSICSEYPSPILPKSRYRYQMTNPIPTADSHGCHQFGYSTATWGANHEYPESGEDFGYLIWRKRNCCAL